MSAATITWNDDVQVVFSDLDETIAGLYRPADEAVVARLSGLLAEGLVLVVATGQGLRSTWDRLIQLLPAGRRVRVLLGACSGAELWTFTRDGSPTRHEAVSGSTSLGADQHRQWRDLVGRLVREFDLDVHQEMDVASFRRVTGGDPRAVMLCDRGSQITIELANCAGPALDLRRQVYDRALALFAAVGLPVEPILASTFALDLVLQGTSKGRTIDRLRTEPALLAERGVDPAALTSPRLVEVWGDNFAVSGGGIDLRMSESLPAAVRSISFRDIPPGEQPAGFNVVTWNGKHRLEAGLREYLS